MRLDLIITNGDAAGELLRRSRRVHGRLELLGSARRALSRRTPAVKGLDGAPFIGETGMDQAYFQSVLRLTPFGEEVVAGRADRAAHNTIDRWWGGTHLTKDALWRFDAGAQRLIAPGG
jgi:hypothetical protein